MDRMEKYKILRLNKRISYLKRLLFITTLFSFVIFSLSMMTLDTYSYFNAQHNAALSLTNATQRELVEITEGEIIYEKKCKAKHSVKVKNIFDYIVKVSIGNSDYFIEPGHEITHIQLVADGCNDAGEKAYNIIGYQNYFNQPITVIVEDNKLNHCPQPAIDNANGRENDNGNGKHCGNQGNPVHDGPDNEIKDTQIKQETRDNNDTQEKTVDLESDILKESTEEISENSTSDKNPEQKSNQSKEIVEDTTTEIEENVTTDLMLNETNEQSDSDNTTNEPTESTDE